MTRITARHESIIALAQHLREGRSYLEAIQKEPWKFHEHLEHLVFALSQMKARVEELPDTIHEDETYVTDRAMHFIDDMPFRLDVRIGADSWEQMQSGVRQVFASLTSKPFQHWGDINWVSSVGSRARVKLRIPKEQRIQELRAQANKLEAELKAELGSKVAD